VLIRFGLCLLNFDALYADGLRQRQQQAANQDLASSEIAGNA